MKTGKFLTIAIATAMSIGAFAQSGTASAAGTESSPNCVFLLTASGPADANGVTHATTTSEGCYATYAQALVVASGGTGSATSRSGKVVRDDVPQVTLGTEWAQPGYGGNSATYTASSGCANNTWTVDDLGSWNNTFQSGKGFGACNSNHKYAGQNENGDSINCTPNCNDYGNLDQRVSSLKWHS